MEIKDKAITLESLKIAYDTIEKNINNAEIKITEHNVNTESHNDIRLLIEGLSTRLNTIADSDDTTLDQMSELVAYIKSNKSLIDSITTSKINVTDIIDNLTTNIATKPLSAAQGVVLKALIDAIVVPTKTSQLTNDSGFLTKHQDLSAYAKTEYVDSAKNSILLIDTETGATYTLQVTSGEIVVTGTASE